MPDTISQSGRPYIKMHGLHNQFVIVDARKQPYRPTVSEIVQICDGMTGIGADELIVIEHAAGDADAFMRIYNGDGREVEACGNASRCVAWLLCEEAGRDEMVLQTLAGCLPCRRLPSGLMSVGMGAVSSDWQSVPLAHAADTLQLDISSGPLAGPVALNIGNPHAVFFVADVAAVDLPALAPSIQQNPIFPDGVNVGVAQLLDAERLRLRVFERGAGLTMACGSGACAAAVAARLRGLTTASSISVELPGGLLQIDVDEKNAVTMTGPIEVSHSGYLPVAA